MLFSFLFFSFNCAFAQCDEPANCTTTLSGTTDFSANEASVVVCISGNYSGNLNLSNGGTVIVESGATWTISSSFVFDGSSVFNNGTIDASSAFVVGPSSVFVNSVSGVLNIGGDLIFNSNWPNEGDQSCTITNNGTINAYYVESVNTYVENFGAFNVTKEMYLHGDFTNSGTVNIVCPAGETNCNFTVGDFPEGQNYSNEGGITNINGAAYFDGNIDGSGRYECTNPNETVRFTASSGYTGSDVFAVAGDFNIVAPMGSNDGIETNDPTLEVLGVITTPMDCLSDQDLVVNICAPFSPLSNTDICQNYIQNNFSCTNNFLALPITLKSFYFELKNKSLTFHWESLSETNFSHFELEKSLDGKEFKALESILATNRSGGDRYNSSHYAQKGSQGYYRLKMIDINGDFKYSHILYSEEKDKSIGVYPNPVGENGIVHFSTELDSPISVRLLTLTGELLQKTELSGKFHYAVPLLQGLERGSYILILENEQSKRSQKIIY